MIKKKCSRRNDQRQTLTPRGNFLGVIAGVLAAAAVSFFVSAFILKTAKDADSDSFAESREKSKAMKQEGKDILNGAVALPGQVAETGAQVGSQSEPIRFVAFACDAGLGSSAMGASAFRKRVTKAGFAVEVNNYAIEKVPEHVNVIVTHKSLLDRARNAWPKKRIITIENFLKDEAIEQLFAEITSQQSGASK